MATITDSKRGGSRLQQQAGGPKQPDRTGNRDGDDAKPARGKLVILVVLVTVVALVGAGTGAYFFIFRGPSEPAPPTGGEIVQMDPTTLSLADHHYLKVQIAIQLVDGRASAATFNTVQAEAAVVDTFSNLDADAIANNAARNRLADQLLSSIQKAYPKEVYDLYITQFVIQ